MPTRGWIFIILLALVGLLVWQLGPARALILQRQAELHTLVQSHFFVSLGLFFFVHTGLLALSVPVGATMNLLGGFFFGRWWGWLVISAASGLGALLAFLIMRYLVRERFRALVHRRARLHQAMRRLEHGVAHRGGYYLGLLRLTPVLPYFLMNALFALTPMRAFTFWWVSQLTILPVMFLYAHAGARAASIRSLQDLLAPDLVVSLVLLGIFPWIIHALLWLFGRTARTEGV